MDTYVDTFRSFLNGSTVDERLRSLTEDPGKFASLAEDMGNVLVNGGLGYYDGTYAVHLRREHSVFFGKLHALYADIPKYFDGGRQAAWMHQLSCDGVGPCFVRTLDNFDILTDSTWRILKSVAVSTQRRSTPVYRRSVSRIFGDCCVSYGTQH